MKIVTAIDSFKGSMTSMEAGRAVAEGIHRADAGAEVLVRPLADGGEGTVEALTSGMNGSDSRYRYMDRWEHRSYANMESEVIRDGCD